MNQTRTLVVAAMQGKVEEAFNGYLKALYPWFETQVDASKQKMVEAMQKWTSQGPITFSQVAAQNPLRSRMKEFQMPDEFRKKLRAGARKGLRR
jgi:uncharacterized protein YdbL (DUF1318 family)